MIKCPKCTEENQIGAIFCRGCGEKLELDDLRPDDLQRTDEGGVVKSLTIILKNLSVLCILIAIGGLVVAAFLKPPMPSMPALNEDETKVALKRFKKLRKGKPGTEYAFTTAEVNMLGQLITELTEDGKIAAREARVTSGERLMFVPENLYVSFTPPNTVEFVLHVLLYDKVNLYITAEGTLLATDNGLSFSPTTIHAGRLPVPFPQAQQILLEPLSKLIQDNAKFKQEVQTKVTSYSMEPNKIIVRKDRKDKK